MRGNGVLVVLLTLAAALAAAPAYGTVLPRRDVNHNGNGTHNHNAFSIRSPTRNSGLQPISNANAGGRGSSRNALCKHTRYCHIHQVNDP